MWPFDVRGSARPCGGMLQRILQRAVGQRAVQTAAVSRAVGRLLEVFGRRCLRANPVALTIHVDLSVQAALFANSSGVAPSTLFVALSV
jgi:hypothetical protein